MTRTNGVRLFLVTAVALLLLTASVAASALPHTHPSAPTAGSPASVAAVDERCGRVIGPAHDYCALALSRPAGTPPRSRGPASFWPGTLQGRTGLLLFSTLTVAAAIGLVSTAGRRL